MYSLLAVLLVYYFYIINIVQLSIADVEPPQESGAKDKQSLGRLALLFEQASKKKTSQPV